MIISSIEVTNLMNRFDYNVQCFEDITLIHAPNGNGKTQLLKLIDGIINDEWHIIYETIFDEIRINFGSNGYWQVEKSIVDEEDDYPIFNLKYTVNTLGYKNYFEIEISKRFDADLPGIHNVRRMNSRNWLDMITGEKYTIEDLFEKYGEAFELFEYDFEIKEEYENNFDDLYRYLPTKLIETNRLFVKKTYNNNSLAITAYAQEIKDNISNLLQEYAQKSQLLDRTFPTRLITHMRSNKNLVPEYLINELKTYDEKRKYLAKIGLMNNDESTDNVITYENLTKDELSDNGLMKVFSLFLEDTKEKLAVFEEMKEKVELFINIINERFQDKRIFLDKNKGFIINFNDGEELEQLNQLSSGEQQTIVLMYDLLFKSDHSSLVLIDEPEISLHVEWQMGFLSEIRKISKLMGQQFIIATHSPQIVNGDWDLMVEVVNSRGERSIAKIN